MPRIIHLSDLHFGAHDDRIVAAVEEHLRAEKPDLVVISGDFTQRARTEQFQDACRFLERLKDDGHEVLGIPGNHDIPLYDVLRRFLSPLTRYTRYVDDVLCPFHELEGATVLGINTARSFTFSDGRVSHEQIDFIRETFKRTDPEGMRILVTHHPLFALPVGEKMTPAAGRSELALDAIGEVGVDLLLAGHNHHATVHDARDLVTRAGSALVIQAGTATSVRVREQPQSFNRIEIEPGTVTLTVLNWNGETFEPEDAKRFRQEHGQWSISKQEVPLESAH
jgi:3',5'-cyclic AMP phosphodiesterase CpdA